MTGLEVCRHGEGRGEGCKEEGRRRAREGPTCCKELGPSWEKLFIAVLWPLAPGCGYLGLFRELTPCFKELRPR